MATWRNLLETTASALPAGRNRPMVPVTLVPQHHSPQHRSPQHRSPQRHSSPSQPADGQDRARRTDAIVSDLRATRPDTPQRQALVDELVQTNAGVARSMASRYRNRGIDLDDLQQVALLGLTKAAQRFDPEAGHDFLSFAVPTVRG